jgi:hypothetical protein
MIFGAKNSLQSAKALFDEKVNFNENAYLEISDTKGIVEFNFFEKIRYGHVNTNKIPVVPRDSHMTPILFDNNFTGLVFDFCAYGIDQILKHFIDCLRYGSISDDQISRINPIESYKSPLIEYRKGAEMNLARFNTYLEKKNLNNKVTDFTRYVKLFMDFYKKRYDTMRPMTLSAHCRSSFSSPLETGLAIKLFPTMFDNDQSKFDDIINSPNFPKYVNACKNFGYSICKGSPNLIIFDINSAANITPLSKNNITSVENLFESRYQVPTTLSLQVIQQELLKGFNEYAVRNPYTLNARACHLVGSGGLLYNTNVLNPISNNNNEYLNNNILNIYITIRYYEESERMSIGKYNQMIKNIDYFTKRFDTNSIIGYIEDEYKNLYKNEPNNYRSFIRKERLREIEQLEKETQSQITNTLIEIETTTNTNLSPIQPFGDGTY